MIQRIKVTLILPQKRRFRQEVDEKNNELVRKLYGIAEKMFAAG